MPAQLVTNGYNNCTRITAYNKVLLTYTLLWSQPNFPNPIPQTFEKQTNKNSTFSRYYHNFRTYIRARKWLYTCTKRAIYGIFHRGQSRAAWQRQWLGQAWNQSARSSFCRTGRRARTYIYVRMHVSLSRAKAAAAAAGAVVAARCRLAPIRCCDR